LLREKFIASCSLRVLRDKQSQFFLLLCVSEAQRRGYTLKL